MCFKHIRSNSNQQNTFQQEQLWDPVYSAVPAGTTARAVSARTTTGVAVVGRSTTRAVSARTTAGAAMLVRSTAGTGSPAGALQRTTVRIRKTNQGVKLTAELWALLGQSRQAHWFLGQEQERWGPQDLVKAK